MYLKLRYIYCGKATHFCGKSNKLCGKSITLFTESNTLYGKRIILCGKINTHVGIGGSLNHYNYNSEIMH